MNRAWVREAVRLIEADANRSADTHLHVFPLPPEWGIDLYLKDESVHPTGSLKHRLARSLLLYALVNGQIGPETTLIEASSGSTAVSEAYFARMLGLDFVAVMPRKTSQEKVQLIEFYGGRCHFVDIPAEMYTEAERLGAEPNGFYLDQFTYAERATDWRGNNNIAESVFAQMKLERHPVPSWIVVGAGTGGTSATFGRYVRYRRHTTKICVVDPENSSFFGAWETGAMDYSTGMPSRIEGIGRPRVEPSFVPQVIDEMIQVPDAASMAAIRLLRERTGHW
ncbi:PLP-dependent cysteine synthase family protein, partial [Amycolatopsis acidicola]